MLVLIPLMTTQHKACVEPQELTLGLHFLDKSCTMSFCLSPAPFVDRPKSIWPQSTNNLCLNPSPVSLPKNHQHDLGSGTRYKICKPKHLIHFLGQGEFAGVVINSIDHYNPIPMLLTT
jgi:hypothetical protein